jgi:hypothetical protein
MGCPDVVMRRSLLPIALLGAFAGPAAAAPTEDILAAAPGCPEGAEARAHCFGLRLHVVIDGEAAVAEPAWIAAQVAMANRQFAPIDVGFALASVDALPASARDIKTRADRDGLVVGLPAAGVVDVFLVGHMDDVDVEGNEVYGVHWRQRKHQERRYVILSARARERTLAHELGHYFGLPHSTYPASLMNKTPREDVPVEQRRFVDEELAIMRAALRTIVRRKELVERR